jgi:predicted dehydrogenase
MIPRVGLVGLGGMACSGEPDDPSAYSHVSGILHSGRCALAATAELSAEKTDQFRVKWGQQFPATRSYASVAAMLANEALDAVDICIGGLWHFPVAMEVLRSAHPPRLVFIEKAPTTSLAEMDELAALAQERDVRLVVSYSRHWYPHLLWLEKLLADGLIGRIKTVVGYCRGPILSMGSHQSDMICQFAGYDPVAVTAKGRFEDDPDFGWYDGSKAAGGFEREPVIDNMTIEFASGVVAHQIGEYNDFWGLYCDIFGTTGRVRVQSDLLSVRAWSGFDKEIDLEPLGMPPKQGVFAGAYRQIADYLETGALPACCDKHVQAVHEIGFAAIESLHLGGQRVEFPVNHRNRRMHIL